MPTTVAKASRRYPPQSSMASPNRSQPGFGSAVVPALMAERYSTPDRRKRKRARPAPLPPPRDHPRWSFPPEEADGEDPDDDREGSHPEQRRDLRDRPEPCVLESLDAGRGEVADPDQDVRQ